MITTDQLKSLRDETGVSVMQCKKALEEAGGDIEKARIILKKKSGDAAAKKADREIGAGTIASIQKEEGTAVVALLCETDFVAKNEDFLQAAKNLADKALTSGKESVITETEMINSLIQKVGENVKLGEVIVVKSPNSSVYNHNGQYASVIELKENNKTLAHDIAMHATAMRPTYLKETDIPDEAKEKAKEIFQKEVDETSADKPEDMKAKILEGKINAYFKEQILLKQAFIKDPNKTIEQLLKENNNEIISFNLVQI